MRASRGRRSGGGRNRHGRVLGLIPATWPEQGRGGGAVATAAWAGPGRGRVGEGMRASGDEMSERTGSRPSRRANRGALLVGVGLVLVHIERVSQAWSVWRPTSVHQPVDGEAVPVVVELELAVAPAIFPGRICSVSSHTSESSTGPRQPAMAIPSKFVHVYRVGKSKRGTSKEVLYVYGPATGDEQGSVS